MKNEHGHCPNCNADLDGGSIWETFYQLTGSEEEADRKAEMYGANREKGRWGRTIALYDRDKDRTVAWKCPDCGHIWERT
jgi:rubrerythrin